jgi:hypothetical protein
MLSTICSLRKCELCWSLAMQTPILRIPHLTTGITHPCTNDIPGHIIDWRQLRRRCRLALKLQARVTCTKKWRRVISHKKLSGNSMITGSSLMKPKLCASEPVCFPVTEIKSSTCPINFVVVLTTDYTTTPYSLVEYSYG